MTGAMTENMICLPNRKNDYEVDAITNRKYYEN